MKRLTLVCVSAVAVLGLLPASVLAVTQIAHRGNVTATFTFTAGTFPKFRGLRLAIAKSGQTLYDQAVQAKDCASPYCAPGDPRSGGSSVHVIDLDNDGQPEVVLNLFSDGAHCCSIEQFFTYDPATSSYAKTERNFGDPSVRFKDLGHNGHTELLTADDAFAYEFAPFAGSGLPIEILTFHARHFTNVTRRYRKLIAHDAAVWWRTYRRSPGFGLGALAAWAADEDNLGHETTVAATLARELHRGHLRGPSGWATGKRYVSALQRFLKRRGYRP